MKRLAAVITIALLFMSQTETVGEANITSKTPVKVETAAPVNITVESEPVSLGEFTLTAYCSCSRCCGEWAEDRPLDEYGNEIVIGSTGEILIAGYSIAVDPEVIPYGTIVTINGQDYKAQDCGGAIKENRIDVYFSNHEDALEFGVQTAEIFLREEVY